jgi:nitroreductase
MELKDAITGRRSIRRYAEKKVAPEVIRDILDLARRAPSSMNGQPWHFVVVRRPDLKSELAGIKDRYCPPEKRAFSADHVKEADAVIVVCVDRELSFDRGIENAVLATANIMLAAHEQGLGTVYMSAYKAGDAGVSDEISALLKMPASLMPVTLIPLGYPAETPEPKALKPLDEMVSNEIFGNR